MSTTQKQWKCTVCGYIHQGEQPPDACPVCGQGPEVFVLLEEEKSTKQKQWKCTVCNYIHVGDEPPEECPVCHQGPEVFVLLDELVDVSPDFDKKKVREAMFSISYGLFVVGAKWEDKLNAQCCNAVIQVTSEPPQLVLGINKNNLTHDYITKSGYVTVGVLGQDGHELVKHFGYQSGRKVDKFTNITYQLGETGGPLVDGCISYFEGKIIPEKTIDGGTHSVFLAQVVAGKKVKDAEPMTYAYYRETK